MNPLNSIRNVVKDRFNLNDDKADEKLITESIRKDVQFRGTNLWTLIFAIFIASIGLNMNATAVIIGAMLISPLMGPIMGVGLAIAINDFDLLKKGVKNIFIATIISILASAVYFFLTPIHDTNSELLARTNPSLWDVLIAFFGGLAGIVAGTRKERSNVIPGVAIATALMPPLCTAGFGLATGNWYFFVGALYLYFINSLLICLATLIIVKHLNFQKKEFATKDKERRVIRSILAILIITILPSIYLAYRIVQRTIFEENAKNYVQKEFHFKRTQVVSKTYSFDGKRKSIELLLIGKELPEVVIDSLKVRMHLYDLDSTRLIIHQGLNAKQEIDLAQIKASILEDVFKEDADTLAQLVNKLDKPIPDISKEIKVLYPEIRQYTLANSIVFNQDSLQRDTVALLTVRTQKYLAAAEARKLVGWMKQRIGADSVKLVNERAEK